ncbi:MAG: histidine phosphatase family protein [Anaerolineae bacterium]|nr:histidine phosphatase family protein [Anaerolineae bacterium]
MIHIILIRHGRTAWNMGEGQEERFRGLLDVPLADAGVVQAQATADRLARQPLAAVYSSPLQRAFRTAEIIAAPHGLAAEALPGLTSMNYGEWAGQSHADVLRRWPELYSAWRRDPFSAQIPGGESIADLRDRAVAALRGAIDHHADGETIVFVTHQVVTRVLACTLASLPDAAHWQVRQDLCNLSRFDYDPATGAFVVVGLNDTCHITPVTGRAAGDGMRIILVRHGQTGWNAGAGAERFRGRTDLPLDGAGLAQARALAGRLAADGQTGTFPISTLYASPLLRAQQTLEPLAAELGLPIQPHPALLDIDYGCFQGLTHAEAADLYPEIYRLWRAAPSRVRFPEGESLADVQARVRALLGEAAADLPGPGSRGDPGRTLVLVGHEIVNKVLVCTLLGLDLDQIWRIRQDPAGLDLFQQEGPGPGVREGGRWLAQCLNDTCHLSGVQAPL